MISNQILRESENASSARIINNKMGDSEQKLPRMKSKALGDVQNTLHSRPGNFLYTNSNCTIKVSNKTITSGKVIVTPIKSAKSLLLPMPNIDEEMLEIHNHLLCEKDQSFVNDYLADYKFSEEQINSLTHSVRNFVTPLIPQNYEPCEDIEIPAVSKFEENIFSVSDIFSDLVVPQVSAPLEEVL